MGEGDAVDRRDDGNRDFCEFRRNGFRVDALVHHRDAQRHVKRTWTASRARDDTAFDADLHGHNAGDDMAFTRGADDRTLVAQIKRAGLVAFRFAGDRERRRAGAHRHTGTLDVGRVRDRVARAGRTIGRFLGTKNIAGRAEKIGGAATGEHQRQYRHKHRHPAGGNGPSGAAPWRKFVSFPTHFMTRVS